MRKELSYLALAATMAAQGMDVPSYAYKKAEKTSAEKKKCKSCALFGKDGCKTRYAKPLSVACERYKKK